MKKIAIIFFFFNTIIYGQDCKNSFSSEYDKFEKKVSSELDHRIVLSTFKTYDAKDNEIMDVDFPNENKSTIKEVIDCIEIYKILIENDYPTK